MNILRKMAVVIALTLLPVALFGFGLLFSIYQVFGSPDPLKGALEKSGVYDAAIARLVQQPNGTRGLDALDASGEEVPGGQEALQQAVKEAVPPSYLQQETGKVLDGIYAWLQDEQATPEFAVNLEPIKEKLVTSLVEQAGERAKTLPACESVGQFSSDFDVFNATCVPPDATAGIVAERTRQQVLDSELFRKTTFTADDLAADGGKPLEKRLEPLARVYDYVKTSVLVSGVLSLVFGAVIIFCNKPRRSGIRRAGIIATTVGAGTTILAIAGGLAAHAIATSLVESSSDSLQAKAGDLASLLVNDLRAWWLGYGIILLVLGVGALIGLRFVKKKEAPALAAQTTPKKATPPRQRL